MKHRIHHKVDQKIEKFCTLAWYDLRQNSIILFEEIMTELSTIVNAANMTINSQAATIQSQAGQISALQAQISGESPPPAVSGDSDDLANVNILAGTVGVDPLPVPTPPANPAPANSSPPTA